MTLPHYPDVLLATYNCGQYLAEFLDSLLEQTTDQFNLIVRDDGSKDDTQDILDSYAPRFAGRYQQIDRDGTPTGSARGNFSILMTHSKADHVFLADCDDVWKSDKIELSMKLMTKTESEVGAETPIYLFTDAIPVDAKLEPMQESFWAFKRIDPSISAHIRPSLVCPSMLGCTSVLNRALVDLSCPVPCDTVTGHDWWAMLVAIAFGKVVYSHERTMYYRLHGSNSSAQQEVSALGYLKADGKISKVRRGMRLRREQAQTLVEVFGDKLPRDVFQVVQRFVATGDQGFLQRRWTILRGGYLYSDLPRNVAMLVAM